MVAALVFDTRFSPPIGVPEPVGPKLSRVTAPNGGPFTFTGTNSYLIGEARLFVLDPGPADAAHRAALLEAIGGRPVEAIVLTHTHKDHSAGAPGLRAATGAPLWFAGPHRPSRPGRPFEHDWVRADSDYGLKPDRVLVDGERIAVDGVTLEVIATPGHCANHICLGVEGTPDLCSGDHVMGWNSTMVAVPDGSMADYLASLDRLIGLPYRRYLPGHGGPIADGPDYARRLKAHREARNAQIVTAVQAGARSIRALQRAIYPDLALPLMPAARMTLKAHVEYLAERGLIRASYGPFGTRLARVKAR